MSMDYLKKRLTSDLFSMQKIGGLFSKLVYYQIRLFKSSRSYGIYIPVQFTPITITYSVSKSISHALTGN